MFQIEKKLFLRIKTKLYKVPKNCIFPKGLTHGFDKKCQIFLYLDLVKIRLEKVSNNILENPINRIFSKGLTHAFGELMQFFSLFVFD